MDIRTLGKENTLIIESTYNAVQFIDAFSGFLDGTHSDETETTRPVRLMWRKIGAFVGGIG
jgi:hypothetical protein